MAMRLMGPSVFHGGFSTFAAIIVTAPSKSYIFVVFFRLWASIIFFGLLNGLILLPVILSFIGPTITLTTQKSEELNFDDSKVPKEPQEVSKV